MANRERAFLSACLIVRDEEKNLPRCLDSIRGIVDEIIIVDTGSVDGTIEIARNYGAQVYEHPWQNDFSFHRNQCAGYANGDWILIIDADEEFCMDITTEAFKAFLKEIPATFHAVGIPLKDMQQGTVAMTFNSTRFFRKGTVKYNRRVHNQPEIHGDAALCTMVHIKHYGYDLTPEHKEKKFQRTYGLMMKGLEENPNDYDLYFYLCQLHAESSRDVAKAILFGEKYLASKEALLITSPKNFNMSIYFTLFRCYMLSKDLDNCKRILELAIVDLPEDLDIALAIVEYGVLSEQREVTIEGGTNYLRLYDEYTKNPSLKEGRFTYTFKTEGRAYVLYHLTLAYVKEGIDHMGDLLKTLNDCPPAMRTGMLAELTASLAEGPMPIHLQQTKAPAAEETPRYTNISL